MKKSEVRIHLKSIQDYLDSLDTCHLCGTKLAVDATPTYCSEGGCDMFCEDHDGLACVPKTVLHSEARAAVVGLKRLLGERQ